MSPAYLAGRLTGFLVRPLLPLAESALAGVLDGLFGEPDALDATYTPTPMPVMPNPLPGYPEHTVTAHWQDEPDQVWTLERDRIDQIADTA